MGQKAFAIGNPFGLDRTLTTGVVSALGRQIESVTRRAIKDAIQTDAAINPGNSGGPLLDSAGRLIGVNAAIYSPSGAYAGIGFAIPVDEVNRVIPQLIRNGKVTCPWLGVELAPDQVSHQFGSKGVLILRVEPDSPAAKAGLRPTHRDETNHIQLGDVITALNDKSVALCQRPVQLAGTASTRRQGEPDSPPRRQGGKSRGHAGRETPGGQVIVQSWLTWHLPTKAMKINRVSMYATFGNKEELFRKALDLYSRGGAELFAGCLAADTARECVDRLLCKGVTMFTDPAGGGVCFVTQGPLTGPDASEDTRQYLAKKRAAIELALRDRFDRAIEAGELPLTVSAPNLARFYSVVIQGIALQAQHGGTQEQLFGVVDMAMESWPVRSRKRR